MDKTRIAITILAGLGVLGLLAAGCGGDDDEAADTETGQAGQQLSGRVEADGSSTVAPFTTLAAERFQASNPQVRVTVGVSGTGGGFERFCAGETDLSDASRPIKEEEEAVCQEGGIDHVEFQIANDALTAVVSTENDWADCLTVEELNKIWAPGSKVNNWSQVRDGFPDVPLKLFGPGTDSGTFDYFTDEINGEEGASRSDYTASEDDNVIVRGVAGSRGGLGYFGFSYFEQNQDTLKALAVDDGDGCVEPGVETAQSGDYTPLSRPLFVYANTESFKESQVAAFVRFMLQNAEQLAEDALFVPLTDEQLQKARDDYNAALERVGA
jgi:phosphate transport system substrate-binding protein